MGRPCRPLGPGTLGVKTFPKYGLNTEPAPRQVGRAQHQSQHSYPAGPDYGTSAGPMDSNLTSLPGTDLNKNRMRNEPFISQSPGPARVRAMTDQSDSAKVSPTRSDPRPTDYELSAHPEPLRQPGSGFAIQIQGQSGSTKACQGQSGLARARAGRVRELN